MSVRRWRGLWRMLLDGEHGFADGYLDGDWVFQMMCRGSQELLALCRQDFLQFRLRDHHSWECLTL
jgi:hypothetical protein